MTITDLVLACFSVKKASSFDSSIDNFVNAINNDPSLLLPVIESIEQKALVAALGCRSFNLPVLISSEDVIQFVKDTGFNDDNSSPNDLCINTLRSCLQGHVSMKDTLERNAKEGAGWARVAWFSGNSTSRGKKKQLSQCQNVVIKINICMLLWEKCSINQLMPHAWGISKAKITHYLVEMKSLFWKKQQPQQSHHHQIQHQHQQPRQEVGKRSVNGRPNTPSSVIKGLKVKRGRVFSPAGWANRFLSSPLRPKRQPEARRNDLAIDTLSVAVDGLTIDHDGPTPATAAMTPTPEGDDVSRFLFSEDDEANEVSINDNITTNQVIDGTALLAFDNANDQAPAQIDDSLHPLLAKSCKSKDEVIDCLRECLEVLASDETATDVILNHVVKDVYKTSR